MSNEKCALLLAGGRSDDPASAIRCLAYTLEKCGSPNPRVAYLGVASQDNELFFEAIKQMLIRAGAGEVNLLHLASKNADRDTARSYLESADAIFLSGGEVEDGMLWLKHHKLDSFLKDLFNRGKLFIGMSAGSIMMGTHWVRWEDPEDDTTAELFECLGFIPTVFDTHAEDEDWKELKTALFLMGPGARGYGIPINGMISAGSNGKLTNIERSLLCYVNSSGLVEKV